MNNENEFEGNEVSASSNEVQNEDIVTEVEEESGQLNNGADNSNIDNSNSSISEVMLEETQYNEIVNSISLLNHTNYLLCALLLAVFIYMFLSDLFERRKV